MKHWVKTTLGKLVQDGSASYQTGPFGTTLKAAEYSKDGVPLISVGEIREGYLQVHDSTPRVNNDVLERLPKYILRKGDIVFGRKGAIDRNAIIKSNQDGWFLGSDGIRLRLTRQHNSLFFSYLLRSRPIGQWLMQNSQGAIMPTLNQSILDRLPLVIPCLKTQEQIAAVLSTLDDKIELNQRINHELEQVVKLLYDYWFVQFDFPMTAAQAAALGKPKLAGRPYRTSGGKMVHNDRLNRDIPAHWSSGDAQYLFSFNPTMSLKEGEVSSYLDMNAVPTRGFMTKKPQQRAFTSGTKFVNGDVVVARITPCLENGKTALITQLGDGQVGFGSTEFIVMRGKTRPLSALGACIARSEHFRRFAILNMTGTSGRKRIESSVLKTFPLPIPPDDLLSDFEDICGPMFHQMTVNEVQNQELTELRDWLLPLLMNGQVKSR